MARYKISGRVKFERECDIEVDLKGDIWEAARKALLRHVGPPPEGFDVSVNLVSYSDIVALDGKIIDHVQWYDLHGPGSIILANPARGHVLKQTTCDGLALRLKRFGLEVVEMWNVGCRDSTSFRVRGRVGEEPFSKEQVEFLIGDETVP